MRHKSTEGLRSTSAPILRKLSVDFIFIGSQTLILKRRRIVYIRRDGFQANHHPQAQHAGPRPHPLRHRDQPRTQGRRGLPHLVWVRIQSMDIQSIHAISLLPEMRSSQLLNHHLLATDDIDSFHGVLYAVTTEVVNPCGLGALRHNLLIINACLQTHKIGEINPILIRLIG